MYKPKVYSKRSKFRNLPRPTYQRRELAKSVLKGYLAIPVEELDSFAEAYFNTFEDCPPDFFNPSDSKVWSEVKKATAPKGWATRILQRSFGELYFATGLPGFVKAGIFANHPENYFSKIHLAERRMQIRDKGLGALYWRMELGEYRGGHDHMMGDKRLLLEPVYDIEVYDLEGLVRYLKKPLMEWNPKNLAIYLKAKKELGRYLPRHSGTIGLTQCLR